MTGANEQTGRRRYRPLLIAVAVILAVTPGLVIYLISSGKLESVFEDVSSDTDYMADARASMLQPPDRDPTEFNPMSVVPEAPVVQGFSFLTVDEAADRLQDDELVMGLVVNGESRAYPVNMMHGPQREIFNDEVGGRAIAATW